MTRTERLSDDAAEVLRAVVAPAPLDERLRADRARRPSAPRDGSVAVGPVSTEDTVLDGPTGLALPVRVYRPAAGPDEGPRAVALPAVVYLPGGGWVFGDLDSHDAVPRALCGAVGCAVVSVNYRRAPEHPFPAAADDALAALDQVWERHRDLGIDPGRLALAGDSAGATLAFGAAWRNARRERPVPVALQALLYPVTDHEPATSSYADPTAHLYLSPADMRWSWEQYAPHENDWNDPLLVPLKTPDPGLLPPTYVMTVECDPLRDEGRQLAELLAQSGVDTVHDDVPGVFHGFLRWADRIPSARWAVESFHRTVAAALAPVDLTSPLEPETGSTPS